MKKFFTYILTALVLVSLWTPYAFSATARAATLYIGPATGAFTVGSTFTLSFFVDTGNQFINVVDATILFPADKIQVVSPSTGASFINVWAIQPSYSNIDGTMSFRGAVPSPGVSTSAGLISTVTFRVKSIGTATVRFGPGSKVLLNDGLGTDILQQSQSGIFTLVLPPPAGPIVVSQTHPDQGRWYNNADAGLSWVGDGGAEGYSYMMSDEPVDRSDNISEGTREGTTFKKLTNGRHYFHIKALRAGVWGGVTDYAVNVDTEAPADFPVEIMPSGRTSEHQPLIKFFTTDAHSGLERYELKIISLKTDAKTFFIESQSPYIPASLDFGRYDVIVRAYDIAGNYREVTSRLEIVQGIFEAFSLRGPQGIIVTIGLLLLLVLGYIAKHMHLWHKSMGPVDVSQKLKELKEYQAKYGKAVLLMLMVVVSAFALYATPAFAQDSNLTPPRITTVSKDLFTDEIFYVGGHTIDPQTEVILYVQRATDSQTSSYHVVSDQDGNWFYRHGAFLGRGSYLVWAQAKEDENLSPPSPQVLITVAQHAVQIGSSRLSYEAIYFVTMVILLAVVLALAIAIGYHYRSGKRKRAKYIIEKQRIDESIKRGFALLRRDIEEEIKRTNTPDPQLIRDLDMVKRHIGEEVWELEKLEETG